MSKKKKAIITISVILAIILIIIASAYLYVRSKIAKINYLEIDRDNIGITKETEESLENYRNIALLAVDSTVDDYGMGNRTDGIIIVSINEKSNEVNLVSVYRDTYLEITGKGLDKVNHAYAEGGAELTLSTLNTNLDLNISEFIVVNFDTVADCVNLLGGIEINVTNDEMQYINGYIKNTSERTGIKSTQLTKSGKQILDGIQAVAYSRIRYTEGLDYKRTERMRTVLTKVFDKAKDQGIPEILNLMNALLPKLTTNISADEIISLLPQMASFKVNESTGWPYDTKGYDVNGPWYGPPVTLESNVIRLHEEVFGQEGYIIPQTVRDISEKIIQKTGYNEM